jgi:transglutaminase-like putative cysteine protease
MRVRVGCEFQYEADGAVPAVVLVRARPDGANRIVYESRWAAPALPVREYRDAFGNAAWRLALPAGATTLRYDAIVDVDDPPPPPALASPLTAPEELPDEALAFTLASRYVESDLLTPYAWSLFGHTPPTWERVTAVRDWVRANVRLAPESAAPHATARDALARRAGTGRDVALVAIALCRALNVPARYAFGYLPEAAAHEPDAPTDFHVWCEAFHGGRWHTVELRHGTPRAGCVVVGHGRDAADVALTTSFGALRLARMTVWADEVHADAPALERRVADRRAVPPPHAPGGGAPRDEARG